MDYRSDVSPATLGVDIGDGTVAVHYLDGRRVTYSAPTEAVDGQVSCAPGKDVHVLVTDETGEEGVLVYVNDRQTHDDIMEGSGVGRVRLAGGESSELFPGVTAAVEGHSVTVESTGAAPGRVFVFEEDEMGERAYELRPED